MALKKENLREGLEKTLTHAESLVTTSIAMKNIGHYRASINLAYQAMEEFGKVLLLKQEIIAGNEEISESRWGNVYKDHPRKLREVEKAIHKHIRQYHGFKQKNGRMVRTSDEESLEEITRMHLDTKFSNQYVNWDYEKGTWDSPLDRPEIVDIKSYAESILATMEMAQQAVDIEVTSLSFGF